MSMCNPASLSGGRGGGGGGGGASAPKPYIWVPPPMIYHVGNAPAISNCPFGNGHLWSLKDEVNCRAP